MTSESAPARLTITDPRVMRALAHPARLTIIEYLGVHRDGRTATELAEVCGLSPSATSYHLRALARFGLVEEAPGRGDARERVWRGPAHGFSTGPVEDAEGQAAERDLVTVVVERQDAQLREWIARMGDAPAERQELLAIAGADLVLTAEEAETLSQAFLDLVEPYTTRRRPDPPAGSHRVKAVYRSFPVD